LLPPQQPQSKVLLLIRQTHGRFAVHCLFCNGHLLVQPSYGRINIGAKPDARSGIANPAGIARGPQRAAHIITARACRLLFFTV
jgi:hypothetical protein